MVQDWYTDRINSIRLALKAGLDPEILPNAGSSARDIHSGQFKT